MSELKNLSVVLGRGGEDAVKRATLAFSLACGPILGIQ